MHPRETEEKEKIKKESAKKAVVLAMHSRWKEAASINQTILDDFPEDLEAYNRLGKALSELGRNREAKEAFQRVLEIAPHNSIARKNLGRLTKLGNEAPPATTRIATRQVFIEESGKTCITSLVNPASGDVLVRLAPGKAVQLKVDGGRVGVTSSGGEHLGQIEPRLASRLARLMGAGNRYDGTVTSVGEGELTIIIREVHKDPSQMAIVSFPSRSGAGYRVYMPSTMLDYEIGDEEPKDTEPTPVKDWSDDDTEPGDDEAFTPVIHRIINPDEEAGRGQDEDF